MDRITCPECGIAYGATLDACPWCGMARPEVDRAPSPAPFDWTAEPVDAVPPAAAPRPPRPPIIPQPTRVAARPISQVLGGAAEPPPPVPPPRERSGRRLIALGGIGLLLITLGALLAEFMPIGLGSGNGNGTLGTTSTQEVETSTTPPDSPGTTLLPSGAPPPPIDPIGPAIPVDELRLAADGIGPLQFGIDGPEAVGRLVATLGQPAADSGVVPAAAELGVCAENQMRTVRWGALTVIDRIDPQGGEVLAGYRLDAEAASGDADPTRSLTTLSGLRLGNTIAEARAIYNALSITLVEREGGTAFELYSSAGRLLLWGPVTSPDESGSIIGIRSPGECSP